MGDGTKMNLPADFWQNERQQLLAILTPRLAQAALTAMKQGAAKGLLVFDPTLSNEQAAGWASAYTDTILTELMDTTVTGVGNVLSEWITREGATFGELHDALTPLFGQSRAARIATTEMTRAFAEGEQMIYEREGVKKWKWNTNRDAIVCPICAPLNGKVVVIGEPFGDNKGNPIIKPPDSHPNCRCWVSPIVEL